MDLLLFTEKDSKDCEEAEAVVKKVAARYRKTLHVNVFELGKKNNKMMALQFGLNAGPSIVIDGEVAFKEKVPSEEELANEIERRIKNSEKRKEDLKEKRRYWSISGLPETWGRE